MTLEFKWDLYKDLNRTEPSMRLTHTDGRYIVYLFGRFRAFVLPCAPTGCALLLIDLFWRLHDLFIGIAYEIPTAWLCVCVFKAGPIYNSIESSGYYYYYSRLRKKTWRMLVTVIEETFFYIGFYFVRENSRSELCEKKKVNQKIKIIAVCYDFAARMISGDAWFFFSLFHRALLWNGELALLARTR